MEVQDTIAAIATAPGGGIGIVRISGPDAAQVVARIMRPWPKHPVTHRLHLGVVHHPVTGEAVDEVLACVMRGPRSYTGEDVAELQGHGGELILRRVLDAVLAAGARMAEAGEFTKRAFLAGRIDLTRAEAVAELIGARSERSLRAARALHRGALGREVDRLRKGVVQVLAELNGTLDFPEDQLDTSPEAAIIGAIRRILAEMGQLVSGFSEKSSDLPEILLLGRVNAGKSSLFNRLCDAELAIVDESPGTTRDILQGDLHLEGIAARLLDTAGERVSADESADSIEQRGLALARRRRAQAQVAVLVVDGAVGFGERERALWSELEGASRLLVWNKTDVRAPGGELPAPAIAVSAATAEGVGTLRSALRDRLIADDDAAVSFVGRRHRDALADAMTKLQSGCAVLEAHGPWEVAAVEIRGALNDLGRVTGETFDSQLLDAIFSRFCIGK